MRDCAQQVCHDQRKLRIIQNSEWSEPDTGGHIFNWEALTVAVLLTKRIVSDGFLVVLGKILRGRPIVIERRVKVTQSVKRISGYTALLGKQPKSKRGLLLDLM